MTKKELEDLAEFFMNKALDTQKRIDQIFQRTRRQEDFIRGEAYAYTNVSNLLRTLEVKESE